jgi:hypothetical protein
MKQPPAPTKAQQGEAFLERTALGVLLLSLAYGCAVAGGLSHGRLALTFGWLQRALNIGVIGVLLPSFWRYFRRGPQGCGHPLDGFVVDVFRRAALVTFCANFLLLLALELVTRKGFIALTPPQLVQGLLCASLGTFGLAFLRMARVPEEDDAAGLEPLP